MTTNRSSKHLNAATAGTVVLRHFLLLLAWTLTMDEGGGGGGGRGGGVSAQKIDGCVFESGGGVINLLSLANTDGTPRFRRVKGDVGSSPWYYSYNPCFPFSEGTCQNVAICQTDETGSMYYNCGNVDSAELSTDSGKPAIKYSAQEEILRNSHVALNCDQSATQASLEAIGDTGNGDYHFVLTSVCACPNGCTDSGSEGEGGLSIGTILIIVLLALVVVYMIGGVIYNKARHQKSGAELCPNSSFWKGLPGTIKDGFGFTCSKLRGGFTKSQYESI